MASIVNGTSQSSLPSGEIMYLIHHIFLPPQLPHGDDFNSDYEKGLLDVTTDALLKFKDCVTCDQIVIVESVIAMVSGLRILHHSFATKGAIDEKKLANALRDVREKGGTIALHVRAQNAGVMISKVGDSINVEVFELSPLNQAVITTKGRLRRTFPGPALSLSIKAFEQPEFEAMVTQTLAKMSHQPAVGIKPKVKKAGQMHDENRDATHPKMVTELFMGVLTPIGEPATVSRLWKNTREEVTWHDSLLPWRRSPMWLLVRVSMQLVFSRSTSSSESSGDLYKMFMVFLMTHVLDFSHKYSLPSDLLYVMNAKIARRLLKLHSSVAGSGFSFIQGVMRKTNMLIHARWSSIVEQVEPRQNLSGIESLEFAQDVFVALPVLDEYIESLANRENHNNSTVFQPKSYIVQYQAEELPACLDSSIGPYTAYNLNAFEGWVASDLRQWLDQEKSNTSTCGKLAHLTHSYHRIASKFYSGNPEAISMMLLTILELWAACDESAIQICELLRDYDPGIPDELFRSLVLPFKGQMERLFHIEDYLNRRKGHARFQAPCIYRDFGLQTCFSVRYFSQSSEHRALLEEIENRATQERYEKCEELRRKQEEYRLLVQLHDQSECEYYEVVIDSYNDFREQRHSNNCTKCDYWSRATSLDIKIHEWPLSSDTLQAQSTVFELKVPSFFGHWRDTTVWLLLDVLKAESPPSAGPRASHPLRSYRGLSSFFTPFGSTQRIGLLSENKPHEVTHRRIKSTELTTESDVCLNNGLLYQYYNNNTNTFVSKFHVSDEIQKLSMYKLPLHSASLQKFLFRTAAMPSGPSPNTVIASQSNCPDHMSLDEYKALSAIPLGYRLQWQNILVQLSAPSVDFKKVETAFVILQSVYQTGPPAKGNLLRASHDIVDDESFAQAFLESLNDARQRIKENWESSQALSTFTSLATRILSLTSVGQVRDSFSIYLSSVRTVAFDWVKLLRDKAYRAKNESHRADFISKAVEIALICVGSFDIDERHLEEVLASPEIASIFIQCSIIIQEGNYTISKTSGSMIHILYRRWEWVSYRGYPLLAKQILEVKSWCLNDAIERSWSAYQAGCGWQAVSEPNSCWLVSTTSQGDQNPLSVHYNLLTGELLVNGLPLARLPSNYESHPIYRTLFGHSALEVMPTTIQGMQFSGKKDYAGFTLHFGIHPISDTLCSPRYDLMVQAVKGDRKSELIPSRILRGDFPIAFVDKFVHWYDITGDYLEFRPIEDTWTSSPDNWRLVRAKPGSKWQLTKRELSLVIIKSDTARKLSSILSTLEDPLHMHLIFHHPSSLEIELPRLQLGFDLKLGTSSIQSRQFRGMFVDTDQSLGTLIGLRNKLMLKNESSGNRIVILPEGDVSYQKIDNHVHVAIVNDADTRIHAYFVNDQLGLLVDNGSLQSKLFLCYLHALTSFCLPDPFIGRTGTEQALSILRSAAVRSFDRLTEQNIEILVRIAHLTPGRSYYPTNERVMQIVKWCPALSFLAQHGGFYKSVKSIFDQAETTKIFHPQSYVQPRNLTKVDLHLLERDDIRSSTFRVSEFGAEDHTVKYDDIYSTRDRDQKSKQGLRAFTMSSAIYHERPNLQYHVSSNLSGHLWTFLSQSSKTFGPIHVLPSAAMLYDATLLLESYDFVSEYWSVLHREISQSKSRFDKFRLMIWLATIAFASKADMETVQTLASFFVIPEMAEISAPSISSFNLSRGATVKIPELRQAVQSALLPFHSCPESKLSSYSWESNIALKQRQKSTFQSNQKSALNELINELSAQWPCEVPSSPIGDNSINFETYIDIAKATKSVKRKFKIWFENHCFQNYLGQIENVLRLQVVRPLENPCFSFITAPWSLQRKPGFISVDDVFKRAAPLLSPSVKDNISDLLSSSSDVNEETTHLAGMINQLETHICHKYEKNYVDDLRQSLLSLQGRTREHFLQRTDIKVKEILLEYLNRCKEHVSKAYENIMSAFTVEDGIGTSSIAQRHDPFALAPFVGQLPRLSPIFFLEQLSRVRWQKISSKWKGCIIHYGLALTELQRAERLATLCGNYADLINELRNHGHTNWNPDEYPESLLLEIESGLLIRDVQEEIAGKMRDPRTGKNVVMQLNMGEGKSSVIVPIVAAALADGSRLVRVIVAKPQSKQMFQMLVSKLGGLLARRVYHMPFSRALRLGVAEANAIGSMNRECMANGGILLVQPEHILSFKLMGLECLISGSESVGRSLLSTQEFFDTSSRDIVDESDENFSVKFELIYTMGLQRPVELSPERWTCIHQVLELVRRVAPSVEERLPLSIEVCERWAGGFPRIRVLRPDAQQQLFGRIAKHICETGLRGFPIARQPESVRDAVFKYVTEPKLTLEEITRVENQGTGGFWADATSSILLLLRGLIAGGVLPFAFGQKRWRVNYGLDPTRQPPTKLAVPYRAKDNPTPRSEFSHPDVVIVLTCLSCYYGGLKDDDLFLALSHLVKSDHSDIEYQAWAKDAPELPSAFRQLIGVNLKDRMQCIEQVFPPLRYAKSVIDYFLAHIVFPKEMKEFPSKLSASGWDIGQIKTHPTTGFSGTNDSRNLLPLTVEHLDLPEQKHTNALVLKYLLQPENSVALMPTRRNDAGSDAELLLDMVVQMDPPARVILDVGAQILELDNLSVAREWSKRIADDAQTQAVVFFDDYDVLSVLDRTGRVESFQISPFAKQLDVCLVYLDEAHTRGTDLRLPEHYRAAVTLGPNLTKDRLVQACMRMRKLGKGQSVVFYVPDEIKTKILALSFKPVNLSLDVSDVLSWAVLETCVEMQRSMPLWAVQGQRFERQSKLWAEAHTSSGLHMVKSQAQLFLEDEFQTLEDRYRPSSSTDVTSSGLAGRNKNLNLIMERCREFNSLGSNSATLQEEQERELSPEIEQERQVQKPAPAQPAAHQIHLDLITFVSTGMLVNGSSAYKPAFETLHTTSGAKYLNVSQFGGDILVTADFASTVQILGDSYISDMYQRPVQWILTKIAGGSLSNSAVEHIVIISPYEAQELLLDIRKSKTVTLHLYAPRPNLGFRTLDGLDLYNVPTRPGTLSISRRLVLQLNIFAGQLYLNSFSEYIELCDFLGLAWNMAKEGCVVAPDGFIVQDDVACKAFRSGFTTSPVKFLKVLMTSIRRNCEDIDKTHMGTILDGGLLHRSDFGELNKGL